MAEVLLESGALNSDQTECADAILFSGRLMMTLVNNILDHSSRLVEKGETELEIKAQNCGTCHANSTLVAIHNDFALPASLACKLEAQKLVLENTPFSIRECMERVAQAMQVKSEEKGLELIVDIAAATPAVCMGDPSRLSQVLLNLVSNAVKFTDQGRVVLSCGGVYQESDRTMVLFVVKDTGIGMSSETKARIFQTYIQADDAIGQQYGGTGLGLTISKKIVEMMGGIISVESGGAGQGSTFSFSLPFTASGLEPFRPPARSRTDPTNPLVPASSANLFKPLRPAPAPIPLWPESLSPLSVLVIDSCYERRHAFCQLLRSLQFSSHEIETTDELKSLPREHPALSTEYCIAPFLGTKVADIAPMMAQCQAMAFPKKRKTVFVTGIKTFLSVSRSSLSTDYVFVAKPVTLKKLASAFETLVKRQALSPSSSMSQAGPSDPEETSRTGSLSTVATRVQQISNQARVLVVDDKFLNQRVLVMKLKQYGVVNVDVASNAMEALRLVEDELNQFVYDLIFMALRLPQFDGFATARRIKANNRYAHVPIVGVSGDCNAESSNASRAAGMVCVLAKPIDSTQFHRILDEYISPCSESD